MSTNNTKKCVRKFYLNSHWDNFTAKLTFPFFYRKLKKWLGEEPGEPNEERVNAFLRMRATSMEDVTLVIPLKERVLILWWGTGDGDIENTVILCPKEMFKHELVVDDTAIKWFHENKERIMFHDTFHQWERVVTKSK